MSAVAALSLVLALAVMAAARGLPDGRTFFLTMGFVAMSTILLAHGLGTSPFYGSHSHSDYAAEHGGSEVAHGAVEAEHDESEEYEDHGATGTTAVARGRAVGYSARLSLVVSAIFFALAAADLPLRMADFLV